MNALFAHVASCVSNHLHATNYHSSIRISRKGPVQG